MVIAGLGGDCRTEGDCRIKVLGDFEEAQPPQDIQWLGTLRWKPQEQNLIGNI
jgi:hypothetical protein